MSTVRDRPACSAAVSDNGNVHILVAGGCHGWCAKNPAIASAEIFDLQAGVWKTVASLPIPLSSAKMDLFGGKPTIVGGYDNMRENGELFQYYINEDTWRVQEHFKMRIPRSSPAVFTIPEYIFPECC